LGDVADIVACLSLLLRDMGLRAIFKTLLEIDLGSLFFLRWEETINIHSVHVQYIYIRKNVVRKTLFLYSPAGMICGGG
jgi:hypothetical protein